MSSLRSSSIILPLGLATLALLLSPLRQLSSMSKAESVPAVGIAGTKSERTFIAIKPDGVQRGLIGEIIKRFEQKGFKLVGLKLLAPTKEQAEGHYAEHKGKGFFAGLVDFFSSGALVAMVWEGEGVIVGSRKLVGATKPAESAPGTIRGDFGIQTGRNIIHGSDAPESAAREIAFWFKENEIINWKPANFAWIYE
jgi:nucleoside-diphosphate kinase